jgi:hypothetical protein
MLHGGPPTGSKSARIIRQMPGLRQQTPHETHGTRPDRDTITHSRR